MKLESRGTSSTQDRKTGTVCTNLINPGGFSLISPRVESLAFVGGHISLPSKDQQAFGAMAESAVVVTQF